MSYSTRRYFVDVFRGLKLSPDRQVEVRSSTCWRLLGPGPEQTHTSWFEKESKIEQSNFVMRSYWITRQEQKYHSHPTSWSIAHQCHHYRKQTDFQFTSILKALMFLDVRANSLASARSRNSKNPAQVQNCCENHIEWKPACVDLSSSRKDVSSVFKIDPFLRSRSNADELTMKAEMNLPKNWLWIGRRAGVVTVVVSIANRERLHESSYTHEYPINFVGYTALPARSQLRLRGAGATKAGLSHGF